MTITRNFNLCLNKGNGVVPHINVGQYDEEVWKFKLYTENGQRFIPVTGSIIGVKADGLLIDKQGTVDGTGQVVINVNQQMTAAAGKAEFELLIENQTHGTANFIVDVEPRAGENAIPSESDLSLLQEAVDSAAVIVEVIGDSDPSEVIGEHVDDWLDAHPEATTTVQDGAITAPKLNQSLWDKLLVSEEASGAVASFDDGADDVPVSSLKVALEPIQTGTGDPSPSNIRPISGQSTVTVDVVGKNLLNYNNLTPSAVSAGIAVNADGTIYDSSPTADSRSWNYESCNWQMTLPAGTYTFTIECTTPKPDSVAQCRAYKSDGTSLFTNIGSDIFKTGGTATKTFTFTEPTTFGITVKQYSVVYRVQIETGETSTEFEPYTDNSYPYTLGRDVYGGTVDLTTGVLTITHFAVALKDVTWAKGTATEYSFTGTGSVLSRMPSRASDTLASQMLSSNYPLTNSTAISGYETGLAPAAYDRKLYLRDIRYTTVADLVSALTSENAMVVIPLTTPTTVQLTPTEVKTLLGYNNISSSGTVEVIYHADTKLYVDKMTNVDNNIIAPTEETFTATRNYTVNDLVIVNDTLYKVTSNIATGSAITPNSNVQQTTLGALIKALS